MEKVLSTILPIFTVIIFGNILKSKGFFPPQFVRAANNLVYHVAIPIMIFKKVAESNFYSSINATAVVAILVSLLITFILAFLASSSRLFSSTRRGSFIQCSIHGNLGYVAFAVAYYFLGATGFAKTVLIGSFLILAQNFLSVSILQYFMDDVHQQTRINILQTIKEISFNPIILATFLGIAASLSRIHFPEVIHRTLGIISSMALPLALFLIGASISLKSFRRYLKEALTATSIKLIILPLTGFLFFRIFKVPAEYQLSGLILLAAPSATISYVMAVELKGDPGFAATNISASTLFSALTYVFWLSLGSGPLGL